MREITAIFNYFRSLILLVHILPVHSFIKIRIIEIQLQLFVLPFLLTCLPMCNKSV